MVPLGRTRLPGWELQFRGVLTIVKNPEGVVRGGLWLISDFDERMLDRYEGYPGWYEKHFITFPDGLTAMTYILTKGKEAEPSKGYLDVCLQGCMDFKIDPQGLFRAYLKSARKAG